MSPDYWRNWVKPPPPDFPTGMRPGEKLYEELITQGEGIVLTL